MSRRKKPKAQSERIHFKRRLRERYGIRINRIAYRSLVDKVRSGNSTYLFKQTNTRAVHRIQVQDTPVTVIYDTMRGELVTALPSHLTEEDIRNYDGT